MPLATGEMEQTADPPTKRRHAYLLVAHRDAVVTAPLDPGKSLVIGREQPADVVIPEPGLSRRHARFTLAAGEQGAAGEITVEDLQSTNHTKVDGKRVERAAIRAGQEVLLGPIAVSVHIVSGAEARPLGLEGHEAFRGLVASDLARARFFGRSLAVLMVRPLGKQGERLISWAPEVQRLLRPIDHVAVYGADVLEILMTEVGRKEALALGRAITAPRGAGAALACGVSFFPGAASAEELFEASLGALRLATAAQPVQAAASEGHRTLDADGDAAFVMESPAMREITRTAARLANAVIPVLIHGETGTGKEVLARLIHEGGPRRDKPLVAVNCGAIPAELLESTLFGHERGAFTGAGQQQKGLFEAADGGTIMLDEVGELPAAAQAALLRVLEEKRVRRVGAAREIEVDVRVIAATHRDLEAMAEAGSFRRDLFYRLNGVDVTLPPLRARREDIAPLAERFLKKAAKANGREVRSIAPEAMALLKDYGWPGNVRELRNAVERAVVIAEGEMITPRDLPARLRAAGAAVPPSASAPARYTGSLKSRLERFERDTLLDVLREAQNNQSEAARLLDMPLRTLQDKISRHGIKRRLDHGEGDTNV